MELASIVSVKSLLPELVKAAQETYDSWNEEDIDTFAWGGICHLIADEFCDVLSSNSIECASVSSDHEQHVYTAIQVQEGIYSVDIPPSVYEIGAGFSWTKIKDVVFDVSDIVLYRISTNPDEFEDYLGY